MEVEPFLDHHSSTNSLDGRSQFSASLFADIGVLNASEDLSVKCEIYRPEGTDEESLQEIALLDNGLTSKTTLDSRVKVTLNDTPFQLQTFEKATAFIPITYWHSRA